MRSLLFGIVMGVAVASGPVPAAETGAGSGEVVVVPLHGQVSKAQFLFLRRALKDAARDGASAVVLDMDTYGGELDAAVKMVDALGRVEVPTVTWINQNAGSAGALIALGTKRIYMSPVSAIGAAAPVLASGQDLPEAMTDKTVSYFSKYFRSAAERNGHNPDIAEAFINKKKEVKVGDRVISEKDSLLTLSAQEAVADAGGRPLLAVGIAASVEEAVKGEGFKGRIVRAAPTGFEQLAFWITALAPVFLLVGIAGAYLELKTPGFGLPGAVSLVSFLIFFTGHHLAGLAGLEAPALFVLGLLLLLVEVAFFPGLIVFGLIGTALVIGSVLWAMVDHYPTQSELPDFGAWVVPLTNLGVALGGATILVVLVARYFPSLPGFRRLLLQGAVAAGPAIAPEEEHSGAAVSVGQTGVAESPLRPAGKGRFGERLVDVVTDGVFLPVGAPIRVVQIDGFRVVVEALPA